MTTTNAAAQFPATFAGRTLFRYVLKIGHTIRTAEQWHTSQDTAEMAAKAVCEDWANGRRSEVMHCYPVPASRDSVCGHVVGGP